MVLHHVPADYQLISVVEQIFLLEKPRKDHLDVVCCEQAVVVAVIQILSKDNS